MSNKISKIGFVLGPFFYMVILLFCDLDPLKLSVTHTAAVATLMAVWWITEAIPIAITALLPLVFFPMLGIMSGQDVAPIYFNHIIFLFIGGFIVALAMQKWDLHKRIALKILMVFGVRPKNILAGFMIATAFLSMWISNTATTMMMIPIVLSVILKLEELLGIDKINKYSIGVFLGVAYSASIGGISTLVGTPPNLSFSRILIICFPAAPEISFGSWFVFALPLSLLLLLIVWIFFVVLFCPKTVDFQIDKDTFKKQYKELGEITFEQVIVFLIFIMLAFLWLFRADIKLGSFTIPGWSNIFPNPKFITDGSIAIFMGIQLFLIPSRTKKGEMLMDWEAVSRLPWNIVLLFGGGFALASGFKTSGLSEWFGNQLIWVSAFHPILIVMVVCLLISFLTELTSNTATAEIFLPILAALAVTMKVNPLLLMIPATLSCSFAFMLPVATPPNAIVFGTGKIKMSDMVKAGIWLNLIGVVLITLAIVILGKLVFGIDIKEFPMWAIMP
ncbi:MAG: SLC13 family permease [Pseudomonadota bacterium]